jgi:alkylation response protein AidB-like acyl-CoA dehydrogenase
MIQTTSRPVVFDPSLSPAAMAERLRPLIEARRAEAEEARRLTDDVVEALREAGAFRLSTPTELGGFELPLVGALDVYEAFGRVDGPVAWNVWNGNLGFAAALLGPDAASEIWGSGPDPIVANSARPAGGAVPTDGGYVLSGRWDIVSAVDIADWVALFALVMADGVPGHVADGIPDVRVFFVPRGSFIVVDTWHTSGMRATGSNSVVVDGAFVPEARVVSPFARARIDRPLYRVPAFTIASFGAAPVVVGQAQAAIDEVVGFAPVKATDSGQVLAARPHAQSGLGAAQTALDAARALLRATTAAIDTTAAVGEPVTLAQRAALRAAMSHAASVARDVLGTCYELASSTSVFAGTAIERIVRDGRVAAQHMILARTHLDIRGRLMLGLDPGTPLV